MFWLMYGSTTRDENVFELTAEKVYGFENQKLWLWYYHIIFPYKNIILMLKLKLRLRLKKINLGII